MYKLRDIYITRHPHLLNSYNIVDELSCDRIVDNVHLPM